GGRTPLSDYATQLAEPFLSEAQKRQLASSRTPPPALFQAAPVFNDTDGNRYCFRITRADVAHVPATIDEVFGNVRKEYIKYQGYLRAKELAGRFLERAK